MDSTTALQMVGSGVLGAVIASIGAYITFRVTLENRLTKIESDINSFKPFIDILLEVGTAHVKSFFYEEKEKEKQK